MSFCLIGSVNQMAVAAAFDSEYTKTLPQAVDFTQDEFLNTTEKITEKPFARSDFEYSVRLPLSWNKSGASLIDDAPSNDFSYGPVVEFIGPPSFGASSLFEVQVYDLKHAMSSFHWLYHHMFTNGYSVEAIEPQSWEVTQATYITFERGNSYKVRLKAILFGPSVVLASYYLPTGSYEKEKGMQARVINNFEISGEKRPQEPLKEYELFNIAKFDFYSSWLFNTDELNDVQKIAVNFSHKSDEKAKPGDDVIIIDGFLKLTLIESVLNPDLREQVNSIVKEAEKGGYALGQLIENIKTFEASENVNILGVEAYELIDQSGRRIDNELWVGVLRGPDYFYFIVLDSPSRKGNYLEWAHNVAAFKLIIESIKPAQI